MANSKFIATAFLLASSLMVIISCEDNDSIRNHENSSATVSGNAPARVADYLFNGTEGDPITLERTASWIKNYTGKKASGVDGHFFGKKTLEKILAKKSCVGIRFYYAMDDLLESRLVLVGADAAGENLLPLYGIVAKKSSIELMGVGSPMNSTDGDSIPSALAKRWVASYHIKNPAGIQAHFFGYQIIHQILSENDCVGIRAYYALNDEGVPQLLLTAVNSKGRNLLPKKSVNGKIATDDDAVADASWPCPSFCPGSETSL
jgi:hypothetical protein